MVDKTPTLGPWSSALEQFKPWVSMVGSCSHPLGLDCRLDIKRKLRKWKTGNRKTYFIGLTVVFSIFLKVEGFLFLSHSFVVVNNGFAVLFF